MSRRTWVQAWVRPMPMWCSRPATRRVITPESSMRSWRTRWCPSDDVVAHRVVASGADSSLPIAPWQADGAIHPTQSTPSTHARQPTHRVQFAQATVPRHLCRPTPRTVNTLATIPRLPLVAALAAIATLPAVAALAAKATLPAVATLPATATLQAVAALGRRRCCWPFARFRPRQHCRRCQRRPVTTVATELSPRTWYGMPACANTDGKIIIYFLDAGKFKARYGDSRFPRRGLPRRRRPVAGVLRSATLEPHGREEGRRPGAVSSLRGAPDPRVRMSGNDPNTSRAAMPTGASPHTSPLQPRGHTKRS
jgi:hypothetical protein